MLGVQSFLDQNFQGHHEMDPVFDHSESLKAFRLSQGDLPEWKHSFHLAQPKIFGCNPRNYRVWASKQHWELYLEMAPVADRDLSTGAPPIKPTSDCGRIDGWGAVVDAVVRRLCIGCWPAFCRCYGCQSLHAIEHMAGIALKVHADLKLARCD